MGKRLILLMLILGVLTAFAGCAQPGKSLDTLVKPTVPVAPEVREGGFERCEIENSDTYVTIPNIVMLSHDPTLNDLILFAMATDKWTELGEAELSHTETGIELSLQFYNGHSYWTPEETCRLDFPTFYFFEDDTCIYDFTNYKKSDYPQVTKKYQMPVGTLTRIAKVINDANLKGIEYAALQEPVTRLLNMGDIQATVLEKSFSVTEKLRAGQPDLLAAMQLDFSKEDGTESWRFVPEFPFDEPNGTLAVTLENEWYRLDFYQGLTAITDLRQPEAPVSYYECPDEVAKDVGKLLLSYREGK